MELPPGFDPSALDLSIDLDGNWRHQGVVVTHPRILAMLFTALKKQDGKYLVCVENLRVPVKVADCPYVVLGVRHQDEGVLLLLTDGTHELLDVASLTVDADNVPRCAVKSGGAEARFSRTAWVQLAEAVREDGQGGYLLEAAGEQHPLKIEQA